MSCCVCCLFHSSGCLPHIRCRFGCHLLPASPVATPRHENSENGAQIYSGFPNCFAISSFRDVVFPVKSRETSGCPTSSRYATCITRIGIGLHTSTYSGDIAAHSMLTRNMAMPLHMSRLLNEWQRDREAAADLEIFVTISCFSSFTPRSYGGVARAFRGQGLNGCKGVRSLSYDSHILSSIA
ncbi:hypothetical protein OE88DRAFT_1561548 [Heliocybe sulcata]|uniref:Uncharacterized protein n=1 Tax=Heliocybe sulcata TaxID=5364 RepID=A0A5C3N1N9_9AGAM|nr:hypothetical protein OE88DRAFT_1561548 [Heliocybe sulcata]